MAVQVEVAPLSVEIKDVLQLRHFDRKGTWKQTLVDRDLGIDKAGNVGKGDRKL